MESKVKFRFFNVKKKCGAWLLFLNREQKASIHKNEAGRFWAFSINANKTSEAFNTLEEAEIWAWIHTTIG